MLRIVREPLTGPVARELILVLNAELTRRYPEEGQNHFRLDPDEVAPGQGAFLVAYLEDRPIGCGAIRRLDDHVGEVKRMFVHEAARGQRVATHLLAALEAEARGLGLGRLILETGVRQPEALALYRRAGFTEVPRYGEYLDSPLSVCLGKDL